MTIIQSWSLSDSGTQNYLSLISGVLFWHEIPFKGDSAIEDEGQVSFPSKEKMEGNNTLVWAAEGV